MKRYFYYLETENEDKLFKYLDDYVDESNGILTIENFLLEEEDDIFNTLLKKYDLIEDYDYSETIDDDYDDFYGDDYEI